MIYVLVVLTAISMVGNWKMYEKMGLSGWKSVVPFYNFFVLIRVLYDSKFQFWWMFIPFYNIALIFGIAINLAHAFDKETTFAFGLVFLYPIFACILGLGLNDYDIERVNYFNSLLF